MQIYGIILMMLGSKGILPPTNATDCIILHLYKMEVQKMTEGKDLLQVLWSGADVLRGKMDANHIFLVWFFINIYQIRICQRHMI